MKLVKTYGNAELGKGSKKPKESKWVKDAQEKTKGIQEPMSRNTNSHAKPLGERINGRPKEAQQE